MFHPTPNSSFFAEPGQIENALIPCKSCYKSKVSLTPTLTVWNPSPHVLPFRVYHGSWPQLLEVSLYTKEHIFVERKEIHGTPCSQVLLYLPQLWSCSISFAAAGCLQRQGQTRHPQHLLQPILQLCRSFPWHIFLELTFIKESK